MTDLIELWAQRDEAQARWLAFVEEGRSATWHEDPVLKALSVPVAVRQPEQQQVIEAHWERRTALLEAVKEAERRVRVATGHEKTNDT
jgi:hypothetical protein